MDRRLTPEEQFAQALDGRRVCADPSVAPLLKVVRALRRARSSATRIARPGKSRSEERPS